MDVSSTEFLLIKKELSLFARNLASKVPLHHPLRVFADNKNGTSCVSLLSKQREDEKIRTPPNRDDDVEFIGLGIRFRNRPCYRSWYQYVGLRKREVVQQESR